MEKDEMLAEARHELAKAINQYAPDGYPTRNAIETLIDVKLAIMMEMCADRLAAKLKED